MMLMWGGGVGVREERIVASRRKDEQCNVVGECLFFFFFLVPEGDSQRIFI